VISQLHKVHISNWKKAAAGSAAAITALLVIHTAAAAAAHFAIYKNKTSPNLVVAGISAGGLTAEELVTRLQSGLSQQTVTVRLEDTSQTLSPADLGIKIDEEALISTTSRTAAEAFTQPLFFVPKRVDLPITADENTLSESLKSFKGKDFKPPVNASFSVKDNALAIKDGKNGYGIDIPKVSAELTKLFSQGLSSFEYQIQTAEIAPAISREDIGKMGSDILKRTTPAYSIAAGGAVEKR